MSVSTSAISSSPGSLAPATVDFGSVQQMRQLCDRLQRRATFLEAAHVLGSWTELDDFEVGRCGKKILICYSMAQRYLCSEDIDFSPFVGCMPGVYRHKQVYFNLLWPLYQRQHIFDPDQKDRISLLLSPFAATGPIGLPQTPPRPIRKRRSTHGVTQPARHDTYRVISRPPSVMVSLGPEPTTPSTAANKVHDPHGQPHATISFSADDSSVISEDSSSTYSADAPSTSPVVIEKPPQKAESWTALHMQRLVKLLSPKTDSAPDSTRRRRARHKRSAAISLGKSSSTPSPTSPRYNPLATTGRRNALFDIAEDDGAGSDEDDDGKGTDGVQGKDGKGQDSKKVRDNDKAADTEKDTSNGKSEEQGSLWRLRPQRFGIFCTGKGAASGKAEKTPRSLHLVGGH